MVTIYRRALLALIFLALSKLGSTQVLNPPYFNLAEAKKVVATSTCGEQEGQPIRELYCSLAGATKYTPYEGYFSYNFEEDMKTGTDGMGPAEIRKPLLQGGQNCEYCDAASPDLSHPAHFMVDGSPRYWQSPPLSRGMEYNQVNITIDLEQEFHVAYVSIQMANSPRPGLWVLERSTDHGQTFQPWQYFAETPAQCDEFFGSDSLQPIMDDDSVICTTEYSQIVPLENGQIFVTLLNNRPGRGNFSHSDKLQRFTRATNVRIRLLRTKTLQGHLMDLNDKKDPTITRRYFYSIKEIEMGGRCVCHGHAQTCDILDPKRPNRLLCRCEHNTCGDQCEQCCAGFEQKRWQPVREGQVFQCEPCNCFGHSEECEYDAEIDEKRLSLDIHGRYEGGGVCKNCQHNTHGINCEKCTDGFFRPAGRSPDALDACIPCQCNSTFFNGNCDPETGACHCREQYQSPNCDSCSYGYYGYPECKKCACFLAGTDGDLCLPEDGQCKCKANFAGRFCDACADGYYNFPECVRCQCEKPGSVDTICNKTNGQCTCKMNYNGSACASCSDGYYGYPNCQFCNCDASGTSPEVCDKTDGLCSCKKGYAGIRCDRCDSMHYGFPQCQDCDCDHEGSATNLCTSGTGQCHCKLNYSGRKCDKCSVGHYHFPSCLPCECNRYGSMGSTCDDQGQCFCKANFMGLKCEQCKENFFNYPLCEECNCDPRGVSLDFAGCDKVPKGDLCSCKQHVTGRRCDRCKPFHWNLQYHNLLGCESCSCHTPGTLSSLTDCHHITGQCQCKSNVVSRDCSLCKDGFYAMDPSNPFGCQPCECDSGGSYSHICDPTTGQCHCKPRVTGRRCSEPIEAHFYPTLQHIWYEAEEGFTEDLKVARYAMDPRVFSNFSGKGFVVFSPIQDEIQIPIDIKKASVYRLLIHYANTNPQEITAKFSMEPHSSRERDMQQAVEVRLPKTSAPQSHLVGISPGQPHPFVLNPGRWLLKVQTPHRLFLDYVVFLPEFYLDGTALHSSFPKPCLRGGQERGVCELLVYPSTASYPTFGYPDITVEQGDLMSPMKQYPPAIPDFPHGVGWINSGDVYTLDMSDVTPGNYTVVMDYQNFVPHTVDAVVRLSPNATASGDFTFEHCPYSAFCRAVVSSRGKPAKFEIVKPHTRLNILPEANADVALKSVTLIPFDQWNVELILPKPKCVMIDSKCVGYSFLSVPESSRVEAESAYRNQSVSGSDLPTDVYDEDIIALPINGSQGALRFTGRVPRPDKYAFIFHYYNALQPRITHNTDIRSLKNDTTFEHEVWAENAPARLDFNFCPSVSGCRSVVYGKEDRRHIAFDIADRFALTIFPANATHEPLLIDYLLVVPFGSYSEDIEDHVSVDRRQPALVNCSQHLNTPWSHIATIDEECKKQVFSLTVDFNAGAMSCECNLQGSTSFVCQRYGGQCSCKPNVIGRRCEQCAPGHYGFPHCKPCSCGANRQCDENTGACFCPPLVEGNNCERCQRNAFGYDPLIGCQSCQCSAMGTVAQSLECDQLTGQCQCKNNVGGRRCERCLAGFYGYPHCYECACDVSGSTAEVCDQNTASCLCKENVAGSTCASCAPGTFNLQYANPKGCTECSCFGTTGLCQSSAFKKLTIMDMYNWKVPGMAGKLAKAEADGKVEVTFDHDATDVNISQLVYLAAPSAYLGNRLLSYGGNVQYMITAMPLDETSSVTVSPDLILKGNNLTIEFWMETQPTTFDSFFSVEAPLLPEKWVHENGDPVSRSNMLMILQNVTALLVKASYFSKTKRVVLKTLTMDSADPSALVEAGQAALAVEVCECPPPYKGTSCEACADGYYRVKTGAFLGSCVPCKCHGHSSRCDQNTGQCYDCLHNTTGVHCERCDAGFYGNATLGTPLDCQICPCPHPTAENNFADSCTITEAGRLTSCLCRPGYTGDRCQLCSTGWYGQPYRPGGKCQPCFCNDNNDLTVSNSCDSDNGHCLYCLNNTDGFYCELCKPWFHGDAVHAKNCTACSCNPCGADWCDGKTGHCDCKPNVEGENCDHCVPNSWGFNYCQGCQMCNCANASISSQCDQESGQCPCKPGAAGLFCDRCADGYWNYSASGCLKCDCESDLAMGTICDPSTGQCQCMEGAAGIRCDICLPGYTMVPGQGCLVCDECVTGLAGDMEAFGSEINRVEHSMDNLTGAQVSSRRFRRLQSESQTFLDVLNLASNLTTTNQSGKKRSYVEDVDNVLLKLQRSLTDANDAKRTAADLTEMGFETNREIRIQNLRLKDMVDKLEMFSNSLENQNNYALLQRNKERWLKEAEDFLNGIQSSEVYRQATAVSEELETMKNFSAVVAEFVEKIDWIKNDSLWLNERVINTSTGVEELRNHLGKSRANIEAAEMTCDDMESVPVFNELPKSNTSDIERALSEAYENINNAQEMLNGMTNARNKLSAEVVELKKLQPVLKAKLSKDEQLISKTQTSKSAALENVQRLERQANELVEIFSKNRENITAALQAGGAYRQIFDELTNASKICMQLDASMDRQTASPIVQSALDNLKENTNESVSAVREATNIRSNVTNWMHKNLTWANEALKSHEAVINSTKNWLDKWINDSVTFQQIKARAVLSRILSSDSLIIAKANQEKLGNTLENHAAFMDSARSRISDRLAAISHMKRASANVQQIGLAVPELLRNVTTLRQAFVKGVTSMNTVETGIALLREKLARTRSLANMIKLGVRFYPNSSLELHNYDPLRAVEAQTEISLFFRTAYPHGLLFFLGNEKKLAKRTGVVPSDDFLAVEVVDGKAKATFDLGSGPSSVVVDKVVSDNRWHRANVQRVGKLVTLRIASEGEPDVKQDVFSRGSKSILNLDQNASKLFIGGMPDSFELPVELTNRRFRGEIEGLIFHGEPKGLWNFALDGRRNTLGAPERRELTQLTSSNGVHLNSQGYILMQRELWNPRIQTDLKFYFKTHASTGLLFYMSKEKDFFAIDMKRGQVRLQYNLGSGAVLMSTSWKYNDGQYHQVNVKRDGKNANLSVDLSDSVEGSSPGSLSHLDVTDYFYVGGVPKNLLPTASSVVQQGFHGCIDRMQINGNNINLNRYVQAFFIESGCPGRPIRLVAFDRPGGFVKFSKLTWNADMEITFRFRTTVPSTWLLYIIDEQEMNSLWIALHDGNILMRIRSAGKNTDVVKLDAVNFADGQWHYLSSSKIGQELHLDADDLYTSSATMESLGVYAQSENTMQLGAISSLSEQLQNMTAFVGCLADVTYNRRMLDFATAERQGEYMSFDACPEELFPQVKPSESGALEELSEIGPSETTTSAILAAPKEDSCALQPRPVLHTPCGGNCYRFGTEKGSRLEYETLSSPIDTKSELSMELRTNAFSGIVLFAWDRKKDYIALYLKNGKLVFEFDSGSGPAVLESKASVFDYQWHYVKLIRNSRDGELWVDDILHAGGQSQGLTARVELQRPFYVGGLPEDVYRLVERQRSEFRGVSSTFSGCIRNLLLNSIPLSEVSNSVGVYPCDNELERGIYFGEGSGHALIKNALQTEKKLSFSLQIKPRTMQSLIFVIASADGSEYIAAYASDGMLVLTVKNDQITPQVLRMSLKSKNTVCDGHWHTIRMLKVKNFLTIGIDSTNTHVQIKKRKQNLGMKKSSLYLGGVAEEFPDNVSFLKDNFVGCMREVSVDQSNGQQRKHFDLSDIHTYGDVSTEGCPVD